MTSPQSHAAGAFSRDTGTALLRGGRLRKTSRGLLTFAPFLATASAVALGALLSLTPTDSAHAQMCSDPMTDGMSSCSGMGSTKVTLTGPTTHNLVITDASDGTFSISGVAAGTSNGGDSFVINGGSMRDITLTLHGDIAGPSSGTYANAIDIYHNGTGSITVTTSGDISTSAANQHGIFVYNYPATSGGISVTVSGSITATGTGGDGVYTRLANNNNNDVTITVSGTITVPDSASAFAVNMAYGGNHILRLRPGAMITGNVHANDRNATLELNATTADDTDTSTTASFDLGDLDDFTNFIDLDKTGDGTWTLTGDHPTDMDDMVVKAFTDADIAAGTLHLSATTLQLGSNATLDIAAGGTLVASGVSAINGGLDNSAAGSISLAMSGDTTLTDDRLTVTNFVRGGTLTLNVNFMDGTADQMTIAAGGMVTGTGETTINLVATGDFDDRLSTADPIILVNAPTSVADGVFVAGTVNGGMSEGGADSFTLTRDTASGAWTVVGTGTPPPPPPGGNGEPPPPMPVMPECENEDNGGTFTCRGAVTETTTRMFSANSGTLAVEAADLTSITVAMGPAFDIDGMDGSTGIDATFGGTITASMGDGINADHAGSGPVSITANTITATDGTGIEASTTATAATTMTITTNGAIMATGTEMGDAGISASHMGSGDLTITANAAISGATGISATTAADASNIIITVGDSITGTDTTNGAAISMMGGASQTLTLNTGASVSGDITADAATATLELAGAAGSSSLDISTLEGFTALNKMDAGTWTLTGVQPADRAFTSADVMAGTLQLNGATLVLDNNDDDMATTAALTIASGATLNLTESTDSTAMTTTASTIMGGVTNSGTLNVMDDSTIMGDLANSMGGTLNIDAATLTLGTTAMPGTLTIASGGTLNITGSASITGTLSGAGAISLAPSGDTGTDDSLSVSGAFTGGSVALDVDLTDPDSPAADQLVLGSATGNGMVTLDLRINSSADIELTEMELDALQLIGGNGASSASFADASSCTTIRAGTCNLVVTSGNLTSLTVTLAASDILYENYAASLAELSRVSGMRARFGNRIWATEEGRGIWARAEASNSELEPNTPSETSAAYEIRDTRLRFGVDAPIRAVPGLILGGNVWLARADTDITAAGEDDGKIETEGYALAATAHWQASTGFYVDGQAQFAAFTNDLSSAGETRVDGNDGRGITLAAEVGYPVPVREFTITPQAQLSWSDVKFDDFTASDNDARISLGDGETVDARIGVSVDRRWSERSGTLGHVWGAIDLRAPLDGETSVRVGEDAPLISEREEPALGLGMGVSFLLRDNTSIAAELATTQGDEIEEYKGSLALRFTF